MLLAARKLVPRTIEVGSGVRLSYVDDGPASGVPVVFLHGITDSWKSFAGVIPYMPEWTRSIAISLRGHGDSSRPDGGYDPADFAADVRGCLDALAIPSAVIVGHSMGSLVAQRFAIDYPERTQALVVMGSAPEVRSLPALMDLWQHDIAAMTDPVDPVFAREFQESTVARPTAAGLIDTAVQESLKVPVRVWRDAMRGLTEVDHTAELRRLRMPTLIVWGTADAFFTQHAQVALRDAIPHARLTVYVGGGHAVHWEDPAQFAKDLGAFCRSLG